MSYRGPDPKPESLTAQESSSGADVAVAADNTSNTSSSSATLKAQVAGTSAGDASTQYIVSGTQTWSTGVDNSDSDKFKITPNAALETSTAIEVDTSGNTVVTGNITTQGDLKVAEGVNTATISLAPSSDITVTIQDATQTLIGKDTVDTLTNKTFDANGTGNSISNVDLTADITGTLPVLNGGTGVTTSTGTGSTVLSASPTFTGTVTTATCDLDGAVTINETGADVDFRVESANVASMLHVDASTDRIGIGLAAPGRVLDIESPAATDCDVELTSPSGQSTSLYLNNTTAQWALYQPASSNDLRLFTDSADKIFFTEDADLGLGVNPTSQQRLVVSTDNTAVERIVIDSNGAIANGAAVSVSASDNGTSLAEIGAYNHAGISNATGYLLLIEQDGGGNYLWADNSANLRISSNAAHIGTTSGTVVGTQTSDERLKSSVETLPYGLSEVLALQPIKYEMHGKTEIGFGAQTTQPIIPEAVFDTKDYLNPLDDTSSQDKLVMDYSRIVPVLVKAVQELEARVKELEAK